MICSRGCLHIILLRLRLTFKIDILWFEWYEFYWYFFKAKTLGCTYIRISAIGRKVPTNAVQFVEGKLSCLDRKEREHLSGFPALTTYSDTRGFREPIKQMKKVHKNLQINQRNLSLKPSLWTQIQYTGVWRERSLSAFQPWLRHLIYLVWDFTI